MNIDDKLEVFAMDLNLIRTLANEIERFADVLQYDGKEDIPTDAMRLIDQIYIDATSIIGVCNDLLKEETQ